MLFSEAKEPHAEAAGHWPLARRGWCAWVWSPLPLFGPCRVMDLNPALVPRKSKGPCPTMMSILIIPSATGGGGLKVTSAAPCPPPSEGKNQAPYSRRPPGTGHVSRMPTRPRPERSLHTARARTTSRTICHRIFFTGLCAQFEIGPPSTSCSRRPPGTFEL